MPAGFYNGEIMFADNVRFDGDNQPGQVTADGQLLIGSSVAPNIRVATLASGDGSVTITNGNGTIDLSASGGGSVDVISGDSGSITGANVTIFANNVSRTAGSTVRFVNSGTTSTLNVTNTLLGNTFIGEGSGTLAPTGQNNTGLGYTCLNNITSGSQNTAMGQQAGQSLQNGASNCAIGYLSLPNCTSGSSNVAVGQQTLFSYTGSQATAIGNGALQNTTGTANTAVGYLAGRSVTSGTNNTIMGYIAMVNSGAASNCTGVGYQSLTNTTGNSNTAFGYNAGSAITTGTGNLVLDNVGVAAETNTIRIGTSQTTAFVQGIASVTVANRNLVTINTATGQLGSMTSAGILWSAVTTNQNMTVNSGYIAISAGGALTFALPTTSSVGDIVELTLDGATSFQITQAVNQSIRFGTASTTVGVTGSITSTAQGDTLRLVCSVANLKWNVLSSIGTLTIA